MIGTKILIALKKWLGIKSAAEMLVNVHKLGWSITCIIPFFSHNLNVFLQVYEQK